MHPLERECHRFRYRIRLRAGRPNLETRLSELTTKTCKEDRNSSSSHKSWQLFSNKRLQFRKQALSNENLHSTTKFSNKDDFVKLRLTFTRDEIGLRYVFLRLSALPDEGSRARALRAAIAMLHETGQTPRWFLNLHEAPSPVQRSITVRVPLLPSDPSLVPVIEHLRTLNESERSALVKNQFIQQTRMGAAQERVDHPPPSASATPIEPILAPGQVAHETQNLQNNKRAEYFQNALKSFDLTLDQTP